MKRPLAVGDLQLGERYVNMDYMFFRSLVGTDLVRFFVLYDIACQWHTNIWNRLATYERSIKMVGGNKFIVFLVPKFHLPAHIEACNLHFSFNITRDVGQTDGVAPERGWANANPLARSTKEMGPGARRDTLNDHFNDWNHKKIIAFGRVMLKKTTDAVSQMVETRVALDDIEASLALADAVRWHTKGEEVEDTVKEWTKMAEKWENGPEQPNPFETLHKDHHLAKVRQDLGEEAAARAAEGKEDAGDVRDDMHITEMIAMGVQLEEQQRTLGFDAAAIGLHPTPDQRRIMVERTSKLRRKIEAWIEDRARALAARTQPVPGVKVQDTRLWLPSEIMNQPPPPPQAIRGNGGDREAACKEEVMECEYRLRVGQANEVLHEIRRQLLVHTHVYKQPRPRPQYRAARRALIVLGRALQKREWEITLKPLADDDVRGMPRAMFSDPERQKGRKKKGPKRKKRSKDRELSWIWLV
ncbi:hypothetical protein B0H10DRAFT_2241820 [Mycena sp. CBHHK59/15]|nr:hypothetical protein B0H10DRAFT_2241820 [Mycena sp. CBHHK59/15]